MGKELRHPEAEPKRSSRSRKEIPEVRQCDEAYQREWLKATGKDTAMNEQRNDPGEGLLEPWERGQGIRMGGAKEGGVPEWRWTEIAEAETAKAVEADKVRSWGRVRNDDRKIRRTQRHGGIVTQKGDNHEEESQREWLGVRSRSTATSS
ncbi:hypothetical protein B0H14DRAFT_2626001 [Mycena olivaceomarginata]|nr:hypothetical protein B0H14DRAFT_2626001 [Mycena olivaceomarginata]